jgi:hypothetical protein
VVPHEISPQTQREKCVDIDPSRPQSTSTGRELDAHRGDSRVSPRLRAAYPILTRQIDEICAEGGQFAVDLVAYRSAVLDHYAGGAVRSELVDYDGDLELWAWDLDHDGEVSRWPVAWPDDDRDIRLLAPGWAMHRHSGRPKGMAK